MRLIPILLLPLFLILMSCEENFDTYVGVHPIPEKDTSNSGNHSEFKRRHKDAPLKILAIGNSFTINATYYMPWMTNTLNGDSICIGRLTRSGCSLYMHWRNHVKNNPDYDLYYSDNGGWTFSDIATLDQALQLFEWDVIVIQQESSQSGRYSTYQPYLEYLARLFREINPETKLAWHYTWTYTSETVHKKEFAKYYDCDQETMYNAIMAAGDMASEKFDIRIPSVKLIKRMREEFPEYEDGFSEDGTHITDCFARYALSTLWYESLIAPATRISSLEIASLPSSVNADGIDRMYEIIRPLIE